LTVHDVPQAVELAHEKLFAQAAAVAEHVPVPLHEPTGVSELPTHDAVPHVTVVAASWHAPPAAQLPVFPHGGAAVH
jgi:hypothetical protein